MRYLLFAAFLLVFFPAAPARAQCIDPPGEAGVQIYNATHNVMQYCDGNIWVGMAGGSGGGGGGLLPDQTNSGPCEEDNDQKIRRNTSSPPTTLEICNWDGGSGEWASIGSAGAISCRTVSAANSVSCDAGEFVTGGGCTSVTALSAVTPLTNGYSCSNPSGSKTAYAICCTNTGGGGSPTLITVLTQGNTAGGQKITNLGTPTVAADAANKTYVDGKFGTLTNNRWCRSNGTQVICDQNAPSDTLAGLSCTTGQAVVKTAGGWGCADMPDGSGGGGDVGCTATVTSGYYTVTVPVDTALNYTLYGGGGGAGEKNSGSGNGGYGGGGGGSSAILINGTLEVAANGGAGGTSGDGSAGQKKTGAINLVAGQTFTVYLGGGGGGGTKSGSTPGAGGGGSGYYGGGGGGERTTGGGGGAGGGGTGTAGGIAGANNGQAGTSKRGGNGGGGGAGGNAANGGAGESTSGPAGGGGGYGGGGGGGGTMFQRADGGNSGNNGKGDSGGLGAKNNGRGAGGTSDGGFGSTSGGGAGGGLEISYTAASCWMPEEM